MNDVYRKKVELLLRILPFVTDEECFAVHGGTAINLFVKNLTRLSVDIDVTYIPLEDRTSSLNHINEALMRIADRVRRSFRDIRIIPRLDICKITCERHGGLVCGEARLYSLCEKAQSLFGMEVDARIVSLPQLYGGKISAALSRQHPRDLFDVRHMDVPLSAVKDGIIFCLLGSDRPIHESFSPNFIDQREAMENQFVGMSDIPFSYEEFEMTRNNLIKGVSDIMTEADKRFLVGFEELTVNREESPYSMFFDFPSVKWKIQNLQKLKTTNPRKLQAEANKLRLILGID